MCVFCHVEFGNSSLSRDKVQKHLEKQHPGHKNKSESFFEAQHVQFLQFRKTMDVATRPVDRPFVICGLNIAHILMQEKNAFTLAETVIKPCLEVAAKKFTVGI